MSHVDILHAKDREIAFGSFHGKSGSNIDALHPILTVPQNQCGNLNIHYQTRRFDVYVYGQIEYAAGDVVYIRLDEKKRTSKRNPHKSVSEILQPKLYCLPPGFHMPLDGKYGPELVHWKLKPSPNSIKPGREVIPNHQAFTLPSRNMILTGPPIRG